MTDHPAPPPDTKDWTWVLQRPCPDCGFAPDTFTRAEFGDRMTSAAGFWRTRLAAPDVRRRPAPTTWSPLEYACHVRDVFEVFDTRYRQMLAGDGVTFGNWDQDVAAIEGRYADQDPTATADLITEKTRPVVALLRGLAEPDWDRTGLRSDGSVFTVDSLGRYHLHDLVHHEWDVREQSAQ